MVGRSGVQEGDEMLRAHAGRSLWRRFLADRQGGTAIEYCLIMSLMTVVLLVALSSLGGTTSGSWNNTASKISAVLK
jgi:Flp pilus assembly pilin Flp